MDYSIVPVTEGDDEFIEDKLVEYNLSMVPAMQNKEMNCKISSLYICV